MLKPIKGRPGIFLEPTSGKVLRISDYREGLKYDTVALPSEINGADEYIFFKNIERKSEVDCNLSQPSKLKPSEDMLIDKVGLFTRLIVGVIGSEGDKGLVVTENSHLRIEINRLLFVEGPSLTFQAGGYGYTNTLLPNPGDPSPVLAGKLMRTQFINHNHDIIGILSFGSRNWAIPALGTPFTPGDLDEVELSPPTLVTCFLHGLIRDAVTK